MLKRRGMRAGGEGVLRKRRGQGIRGDGGKEGRGRGKGLESKVEVTKRRCVIGRGNPGNESEPFSFLSIPPSPLHSLHPSLPPTPLLIHRFPVGSSVDRIYGLDERGDAKVRQVGSSVSSCSATGVDRGVGGSGRGPPGSG